MFRQLITRGPVAADADADKSGTASLPLGLINGMEDALADAVQIPAGFAQAFQLAWQAVGYFCFRSRPLSG